MKKILLSIALICATIGLYAQAIQPSMMVMPSKSWCHEHGYEKQDTKDNGKVIATYEYERALIEYKELGPAIRKIGELMQQRGFKLVDFQQTLESMATENALESVEDNVDNEDPEAAILAAAGTDLNLRINWFVQTVIGGRQQLTYELTAYDSFSNKQVANTGNTTPPQAPGQTEVVMLQNAVIGQMDQFVAQLMSHFNDMQQKGREIALRIYVTPGWEDGLDTEVGEEEETIADIIEKWVTDNTISHRYHLASATSKSMNFDSAFIPLFDNDGNPIDAGKWSKQLRKFLKKKGVPCKVLAGRSLGQGRITIGKVEE